MFLPEIEHHPAGEAYAQSGFWLATQGSGWGRRIETPQVKEFTPALTNDGAPGWVLIEFMLFQLWPHRKFDDLQLLSNTGPLKVVLTVSSPVNIMCRPFTLRSHPPPLVKLP